MSLLNLFKKKKPTEKKTEKAKVKAKADAGKKPLPTKKSEVEAIKPKLGVSEVAYRVFKKPRVTEKATDLARQNKYVFEVFPGSNKPEIKKAVEGTYGVEVLGLNIIRIPSKKRRLGKTQGWRKAYKKAIVRIKEGQRIEVLPR